MDLLIIKAKWRQIRGKSRILSGKLTDNQYRRFSGRYDVITGEIQERYNLFRHSAIKNVNQRISGNSFRLKRLRQGRK